MSVLEELNYINQAAFFPCHRPDPVLIIQAAGAAVFPVLIGAITFSCLDIIKMRAGISPWHARGMRALIKGAIPGQQIDQVGKVYKFVIPLEKILFFWFVVDLTLEFIARWQSNIFKLGACGVPSADCHWSGDQAIWVSPGFDIFGTVSYQNEQKHGFCNGVVSNGFAVRPGQYWQCNFEMRPEPFFTVNPIGAFATRLVREHPVTIAYPEHHFEPDWFGNPLVGSYQASGRNETHGTQVFRFQAATDVSAHAKAGSAWVQTSDRPLFNKDIIPVNCFGRPAPAAQQL